MVRTLSAAGKPGRPPGGRQDFNRLFPVEAGDHAAAQTMVEFNPEVRALNLGICVKRLATPACIADEIMIARVPAIVQEWRVMSPTAVLKERIVRIRHHPTGQTQAMTRQR
jgi:hypothetical protein